MRAVLLRDTPESDCRIFANKLLAADPFRFAGLLGGKSVREEIPRYNLK
jgi:hypothetical protein